MAGAFKSYDGAAYRDQLKRKRPEDTDLQKVERYPVITLVLYFGYKRRWIDHRSIKDSVNVPDKLKPYVKDYEINIFEIAYLERDTIDKFRSDFRILADYCYQMRTTGDYIPSPDELKYPKEIFEALSAFTDDDRFEQIYNEVSESKEGGRANMCEYLDRLEAKGIAKGRAEGMREGIGEGERNTLINLVKKGLLTIDEAMEESSDPEGLAKALKA